MKHPQTAGSGDPRHPQAARPCGPTRHEGCACHEARRDATRDRLQAEVDELREMLTVQKRETLRRAEEVQRLRTYIADRDGGEPLSLLSELDETREELERWKSRTEHAEALCLEAADGIDAAGEES